jgi:hypothetical protein
MKSVRERMDINAAYREVGTYRGAADICGTTHKTVKRVVEASERAGPPDRVVHNYNGVSVIVAERVEKTQGRITAKRLLPVAIAAGYAGSARCSCSARCWRGAGGGSCTSPTTWVRTRRSLRWRHASRTWAGSRRPR